jgi:hypothetical protein
MHALDLEQQIAGLSKSIILGAALILVVLVVLSISLRDRVPKLKPALFAGLATTLLAPTLFLIVSTIYLNVRSESGGPVHWHAEIEFWACGTELELRDPTGFLSNKIGTSTYHEHNDKHIHLEGVVVNKEDASLGKFMRVTGGSLSSTGIDVPLNQEKSAWFATGDKLDGDAQGTINPDEFEAQFIKHSPEGLVASLRKGGTCNNQPAQLQTFVYTYNKQNDTYSQRKLENPAEYIIRDESSLGPPSDCVIFEYDTPKERTDKLCEQYGVRDRNRCKAFGVKKGSPELCNITEVQSGGTQ